MSPKELSYIEDALGHEQFMKTKCNDLLQSLSDNDLKQCVQQMLSKHDALYSQLYNLI